MTDYSGTNPQQTGPATQGNSHAGGTAELNGGLDQLRGRLDRLGALQRTPRYFAAAVLVAVVLEFALFYATTRQKVEANFTQASVQQSVAQRVPQITPQIRDAAVQAFQDAWPAYRQLALERLSQRGGSIANDALAHLRNFPAQVSDDLGQRLRQTFDATVAKLEPQIRQTYPTLTNEQTMAVLQVGLYDKINEQNEAIAQHLQGLAETEKVRLVQILAQFQPPQIPAGPAASRERVFLHSLVDVMLDTDFQADLSTAVLSPAPAAKTTANALPRGQKPTASIPND